MFNGIIYNTGKVISVAKTKKSIFIGILTNTIFKKKILVRQLVVTVCVLH